MRDLIVKDNALINASYNLDLVEQRLILLAIVEARESGKGINANDPLEIHADSYINQFGVHRNTAYQALKDACKDLFARQFSYQEKKANGNTRNVMSRWVSQIAYNDNEAIVDLIFAPAVVPFITRLEEQFTKYELQQVRSLSSAYAIRLYELLIQWRSAGKTPFIELQDFRKKLGVLDNEYLRMAHLKERILELSIKQINEHTDIIVEYQQHKRGRSIAGFSFTFKQKKNSPSIERDPNTFYFSSKMTDAQRHMFANKLSELPEMSKYSQGTESYQQFAIRIAEMLQDPTKLEELYPYLNKVGFKAT
ncbi:replication initiation protein RepM [Acinetobacter rudis]|uniref:replication initiation protein RepM n=1 Tax=Acinetobacter TaxID=469 RepID=UPI00280D4D65|nr:MULTISPECIES: replication initiation protein RepM [Acinetobacter]MDQ8954583.1 replication initiation protein RepM [Acinetobacter rudis]MDQ9023377.1 replication initiation protein RepM [Acinetobacter sichuanensis]